VTSQLEIPPEAIEAGVERWNELSLADDEQIAAVLEETDWASHCVEESIRAALPHLFSLFAEGLTSDEAVRAMRSFLPQPLTPAAARGALAAVAAALVPGAEDGRDG